MKLALTLNPFAATIFKLDTKFNKPTEGSTGRPQVDIKSAYRLGPIKDKATRPRSIKVLFATNHFNYEIFKNIKNLKGKEQWKGVHISDSVTTEEQERRWDMRCI